MNGSQLAVTAAAYAAILATWYGLRRSIGRAGFYLLFACSVTVSVQLVGLYLVFTTLIVPALATRHLSRYRIAAGYVLSTIGYAVGLGLSAVSDLPPGPLIVWVMTAIGFVVFLAVRRNAHPA